jgi:hypothetical protein
MLYLNSMLSETCSVSAAVEQAQHTSERRPFQLRGVYISMHTQGKASTRFAGDAECSACAAPALLRAFGLQPARHIRAA